MMALRTTLIVLALFAFGAFVQAQIRPDLGADSPIQWGKLNAKFRIEVFIDLQCPSCANFSKILRSVETKHPGELLITFRHFPLAIPAHDKAYEAAKFLEAAHHQQKGLEM